MRTYNPQQRIEQLQRQKEWYIKNQAKINIKRSKNPIRLAKWLELEKQPETIIEKQVEIPKTKPKYFEILEVLKKDIKSKLNKKRVCYWNDNDWNDFYKLNEL
jgi:hypothetical protein